MSNLYWIHPLDDSSPFPDVERALREPEGLLAAGGNLSVPRLINAYRKGIFPWYSDGQPILWWSPDPRLVLFPAHLKISRSLRKTLRRQWLSVTFDRAFAAVVERCAEPRLRQNGTWITADIKQAYIELHRRGIAHSAEAWDGDELVGGLYGVALGQVFFGESMFTRRTDASKVAFVHLVRHLERWGYNVIDCQVTSAHLQSLGATEIPRREFSRLLEQYIAAAAPDSPWQAAALTF